MKVFSETVAQTSSLNKEGVLKNFAKFTGFFPVNFARFFRTPLYIEHLQWLFLKPTSLHLDLDDPIVNGGKAFYKRNEKLVVKCEAYGSPPVSYIWLKDGRKLSGNKTLVVDKLQLKDEGLYECVVSNGLIEKQSRLSVKLRCMYCFYAEAYPEPSQKSHPSKKYLILFSETKKCWLCV